MRWMSISSCFISFSTRFYVWIVLDCVAWNACMEVIFSEILWRAQRAGHQGSKMYHGIMWVSKQTHDMD